MKSLKKIKLNQLNKTSMEKREMEQLIGGSCCGCGCNGSSSSTSNANANWYGGYSQSYGGEKYCACYGDSSWSSGW